MKVKICGIKTLKDALMVIESGADIIGFNFYPASPRYITPGDCMGLMVRLEMALREKIAQVTTVGVFVNAHPNFIHAVFRDCHLDRVQLSGDEQPEDLEQLGERAFKVLRPQNQAELDEALLKYPARVLTPAYMIDTYRSGAYGGTGETADWEMVHRVAQEMPILLAGGLRPDNVAEAIRKANPWGVDVASGVESAPGVKDPAKVREFIQAVRACTQEEPA